MPNILLKFLIYLFYLPFSILAFVIIRLISPFFKIKFAFINSHRIGHIALQPTFLPEPQPALVENQDGILFPKLA